MRFLISSFATTCPTCLLNCLLHATLQGVASIGRLTALTELRIACCNKLTGNGTLHLAPLSQLRALALESCVRVGDAALLRLLPHLPRLAELSVLGCCKVRAALPMPAVGNVCKPFVSDRFSLS